MTEILQDEPVSTTGNHYTVLARRFRPQAFGDVVGQEHVSRALLNAIRAGRVAHAYMFTGARGVGKTSTARILAKALNCPNVVDGVPCNSCEICDGISSGNDVDVLEIDGASNRGIDDIRALRANVGVRSMRTKFKVYIIDEVHALSKDAFNALLKTLEEPPPNVKFVFCTTEPNKVPDTILSRCQRFDFSTIADGSIADRLREIASVEGFTVSEDALELVARRARGSMRDSQSLFDQLLAFSDGEVTADDVHRMLGTAGDERLVELFNAIVEHRPGEVMTQLDAAFDSGVQSGEFMDQAIGYVRDLMVTLAAGDAVALVSVSSRLRGTLQQQAQRLGLPSVMAAFQILARAKDQMFRSTFARTILEMALVQVSVLENLTAITDLLSGRLPALLDSAIAPVSATTPAGASGSAPLPEKKKGLTELPPPAPDADESNDSTADGSSTDAPSDDSPAPMSSTLDEARNAAPSANIPAAAVTQPLPLVEGRNPMLLERLLTTEGARFVSALRQVDELSFVPPGRIEARLLRSREFAGRRLEQVEQKTALESAIQRLTGQSVSLIVQTVDDPDSGSVVVAAADTAPRSTPATRPRAARSQEVAVPERDLRSEVDASSDPFVRRVLDTFGGTVIRVTAAPVATDHGQDDG